jgi:hypothetical protein
VRIEVFNVWVKRAEGWERYRNCVPSLTLAGTVAGNARILTGCEVKIIESALEEAWLKSVGMVDEARLAAKEVAS